MPEMPLRDRTDVGEILTHQTELRRRALGYTFKGPQEIWCDPQDATGVILPLLDASTGRFTGCAKYASCSLIPDSARWKRWSEMTADEQRLLQEARCYRATRRLVEGATAPVRAQAEGMSPDPFGIRSPRARGSTGPPCPVGGCITPEEQYCATLKLRAGLQGVGSLSRSQACPFDVVHTNAQLTRTHVNPLRFAQCYVTLPPLRSFLEERGIVVVAPVHRSVEGTSEPGDAYWYPFYSGYSLLQFPTRVPLGGAAQLSNAAEPTSPPAFRRDPAEAESLSARWILTRMSRALYQRSTRRLPMTRVFEDAQSGYLTTPWEREVRVLSVSEGQATFMLLQWVMMRRVIAAAAGGKETIDVAGKLTWTYANRSDDGGFYDRLLDLEESGYDLAALFQVGRKDERYVREATLAEDLHLLGLTDKGGRPGARVACALHWLAARLNAARRGDDCENDGFDAAVAEWAASAREFADELCISVGLTGAEPPVFTEQATRVALPKLIWLVLLTAVGDFVHPPGPGTECLHCVRVHERPGLVDAAQDWIGDRRVGTATPSPSPFQSLCQLVPQLHVLVRAWWMAPLRWFFVPLSAVSSSGDEPKVTSALIVMMEDSLESAPYLLSQPVYDKGKEDPVLAGLLQALPILTTAANLEGACLQEQVVGRFVAWETNRGLISQVAHEIRNIRRELEPYSSREVADTRKHLNLLEAMFQVQLTSLAAVYEPEQPDVRVSLRSAVREACDIFNSTFWGRHYPKVLLMEDDEPAVDERVLLTPIEQRYRENEPFEERTRSALCNLVLFGLMERAPKGGGEPVVIRVFRSPEGNRVIAIDTATRIGKELHWEYPRQDLNTLPIGRGFYGYFAFGIALGAVTARVTNTLSTGRGLVELGFRADHKMGEG